MTDVLRLENVSAYYNYYKTIQALNRVSFRVREKEITVLLGANGAGKTTVFRAISGLVWIDGSIFLGEQRIDHMESYDVARMGLAHVPEKRGIFQELTVDENLRLGAMSRRDRKNIAADLKKMYEYFPKLWSQRNEAAGNLSGGEQQMLALGRGLMLRPRLLMLDEPSIGLAPLISKEFFRILKVILKEEGVSVLLNEQNAALALQISDYTYILETGRIVAEGKSSDIRDNVSLQKTFLG